MKGAAFGRGRRGGTWLCLESSLCLLLVLTLHAGPLGDAVTAQRAGGTSAQDDALCLPQRVSSRGRGPAPRSREAAEQERLQLGDSRGRQAGGCLWGLAHSTNPELMPRFRSGRRSEWGLGLGEASRKGCSQRPAVAGHTRDSTCHISHVLHSHSHHVGFMK